MRSNGSWRFLFSMIPVVTAAIALTLLLAACDEDVIVKEKPNLLIWEPTSVFEVASPVKNDPTYKLTLTVMNFGLTAVPKFDVACTAIGTDIMGGNPEPSSKVTLQKDNLSVGMFTTEEVVFTLKWNDRGAITGTWKIDCEVDSAKNVVELSEVDNTASFLFKGYCIGTLPCPGKPQTG